jgi:hypothetical protein
MALEKMRRFVFVIAAVALFLATVMPGIGVNADMAASAPTVAMAAMDGMDCPDCDTSPDNLVGCTQAICIGFAVMADGGYFDVPAPRPAYAIAAVARPDDLKSAPSTPPI